MKVVDMKISFLTAVVFVTLPFNAFAQDASKVVGTTKLDRGLGRLTLLTGPDILSPARGMPQPASDTAPAFKFSTTGRVYIPAFVDATHQTSRNPSPELLRFDSRLPSLGPTLRRTSTPTLEK